MCWGGQSVLAFFVSVHSVDRHVDLSLDGACGWWRDQVTEQ